MIHSAKYKYIFWSGKKFGVKTGEKNKTIFKYCSELNSTYIGISCWNLNLTDRIIIAKNSRLIILHDYYWFITDDVGSSLKFKIGMYYPHEL